VGALLSALSAVLLASSVWWRIGTINASTTLGWSAAGVTGDRRAERMRRALLAAQIAIGVVVGSSALTALDRYRGFRETSIGVDTRDVTALKVTLPPTLPGARRLVAYDDIKSTLAGQPGVREVALSGIVPGEDPGYRSSITIDGIGRFLNGETDQVPGRHRVGPGYFRLLQTHMVSGREFAESDGPTAPRVAVINESMARLYWDGRNPIGARLKFGRESDSESWATVVGVVGDVAHMGLRSSPRPEVYTSLLQDPLPEISLLMRGELAPETVTTVVGRTLARSGQDVSVDQARTLDEILGVSVRELRYVATFVSAFTLMIVLVVGLGLHATTSLWLRERERELAIRTAVGASPQRVASMILWSTARVAVLATAIGMGIVSVFGRVGAAISTEIVPPSSTMILLAGLASMLWALACCLASARRSFAVDAARTLRA
jgi:hypothetical protein